MTDGEGDAMTEERPASEGERTVAFLLSLRAQGVRDLAVLRAMEKVARERFAPARFADLARQDVSVPLPCGQTMTAPHTVAALLTALDLQAGSRVLEIGTGSGYQTLILSRLVPAVWSLERIRVLQERARMRLARLRVHNVRLRLTDGGHGWPQAAPFDTILLTACASELPDALLAQLGDGGTLIAPIEDDDGEQWLTRVERHGERYHHENHRR